MKMPCPVPEYVGNRWFDVRGTHMGTEGNLYRGYLLGQLVDGWCMDVLRAQ